MTHLRLWRFVVPAEAEDRFVAAYGSDGDWARLFATAPGFIRTELWRGRDGSYVTADHWNSLEDFERFQSDREKDYRLLEAQLEAFAGVETCMGAYDLDD